MASEYISQSVQVLFQGSPYFDGNVYWGLTDNPQPREDFDKEIAEMEAAYRARNNP
jgi:hypothetical protein